MRMLFARFIAKRTPKADAVVFTRRNIYVFFSQEGALYAFLIAITFVSGVNYGNNLVLGFSFYLIGMWVIGIILAFLNLQGVKVRVTQTNLPKAGDEAQLKVQFESQGRLKHAIAAYLIDQEGNAQQIDHLDGTQTLTFIQETKTRGALNWGYLVVETKYPFGVARAWGYVQVAMTTWVSPAHLPSIGHHNQETSGQGIVSSEGDLARLDAYQEGESLARVVWSQLARGRGMLSKKLEQGQPQHLILDYNQMTGDHEARLSKIASAVFYAPANAPFVVHLPDNRGQVGQGNVHKQNAYLRLAQVPK